MFYVSAVIYAIGTIFFTIFAEGEVQPWVRPYMFDEEVSVAMAPPSDEEKPAPPAGSVPLLANKPENDTDLTKV